MNREDAIARLKFVWGERPTGILCLALLDFIVGNVKSSRISYGQICQIGIEAQITSPEFIAQAIQYLTGHDLRLLDIRFEFIDDDDQIYPVDIATQIEAENTGEFFHPLSGELVPDYEEELFVFFSPSSLAHELAGEVQ